MSPFEYNTYTEDDIKIRYSVRTSDEDYMRAAHRFLQKLMKEFARLSIKCYRPEYEAYNMPFYYSERRLDSVVLPALSNICDGMVLTEMPVERKERKTGEVIGSGHGRADYWCIFDGYTFVIEMKGSHARVGNYIIRKSSVVKRWKSMVDQLESEKDECYESQETTKGIIRLGLHFLTNVDYEQPTEEKITAYRRTINDRLNDMYDRIHKEYNSSKYDPSYAAAWMVPDEIAQLFDDETDYGVILLAKIFRDIKHKNHV